MKSGVYTITNLVNNKIYVGYATNMYRRRDWHFCSLRAGTHTNAHLQAAYNKYGVENLVFGILEREELELLAGLEHYWCNMLNAHDREFGYNIQPTHPDNKPRRVSEETREKLRASHLGQKNSLESIEKARQSNLGKKRDPVGVAARALKKKLSLKNKGVDQFDLQMNFIKSWVSAKEIERELGYANNNISMCCRGKYNTAYKYIWRFNKKENE